MGGGVLNETKERKGGVFVFTYKSCDRNRETEKWAINALCKDLVSGLTEARSTIALASC